MCIVWCYLMMFAHIMLVYFCWFSFFDVRIVIIYAMLLFSCVPFGLWTQFVSVIALHNVQSSLINLLIVY